MTRPWTDAMVRDALGLRVELADAELAYTGVSTDSRTVTEGDLYVALVGDRFDGHDFVADALATGARAAVVSKPFPGDEDARIYPVEDTLVALGALAAFRRAEIAAPVVAITGSSGKTTTKNMTAAALGAARRVHATPGNWNNRIGMPLTLLAVPDDAEAVVLELGTNEPGEIRTLAQIARPDIGIVTTVGESHLEKLGSIGGVLEEKLDLLRYLAEGGECLVGDEPEILVTGALQVCPGVTVVGWSEHAHEDRRTADADVDVFGRYTFTWKGERVTAPAAGRHAVTDSLLALTVADLLGVPAKDAIRGLGQTQRDSMRGEKRRIGGLTVVVDCYNANPQSVRASLEVLELQSDTAKRVAVLGTMLELGDSAARLHREVLADAMERELDLVVATGEFADAARDLGVEERVVLGQDWGEAYPELAERLDGDEIVLLKASRGVALEGILDRLVEDFSGEAVEA